ncbi:MAG TPA: YggT family protein [Syntrophorhabdaceae bacterium]|nr:YggT family protein [Syntrophorhabdaceae bacterium]HRR70679.1 YggT family protein [Syntrophorhabdaceae bacterium]HRV21573.1 YggT family protein [Syntrophorhabdaceae bacterium]
MFVFGNLFSTIASILNIILDLYFWVIFIRAIMSWFNPNPYNPIVRTIYRLVDPITYRISRIIPTRFGVVDLSPFILMLIIIFIQRFVVKTLFDIGMRMG